jgi:serine/threonine protein kinase
MLEYIPSHYFNLGLPPTFDTCTRDVYPKGFSLSFKNALKIIQGIASAAVHMHKRGIMHGDFYAHNIMIDTQGNSILGDFGGASYFEPDNKHVRQALERLEVRAFGYFIEEMLILSTKDNTCETSKNKLIHIKEACLTQENQKRPLFKHLLEALNCL